MAWEHVPSTAAICCCTFLVSAALMRHAFAYDLSAVSRMATCNGQSPHLHALQFTACLNGS